MKHEEDEIPNERDVAFAAANLRAWADHVEATGEGVRVESYAILVSAPIDGAPRMAPLSEIGSIGWRHEPKLQHRNRSFDDHGSPWSGHHKHAAHPYLPPLDAPPPEPPCQLCGIDIRICRCDEDDLREAIRELKLQIEQRAHDPRCYAVDDPGTPRRGPKRKWFLSGPTCRHDLRVGPGRNGSHYYISLTSFGTPICCSEPKDWLLDQAFEEPLRELVRKMRGESDGHVPLRISVPDDPITTAAVTPGWCRDANGWASIDSDPYGRPKATP